MLYNGVNHFNWQVNNFSDTWPGNTGVATLLTADGSAHTKGTDTAVLTGIAYDCWGIGIWVSAGSTDATIRRQMIDLLIDPTAGVGNAGSSWSVAINNIYTNSPAITGGNIGHAFYFPLFLPAGTAIGARVQDVVGGATCRFSIRIQGQPSRPDLTRVGTVVQTIGATGAAGSYSASIGTLTRDAWWWQLGVGTNDATIGGNSYYFDIATDATTKYVAAYGITYYTPGSTEITSKNAFGHGLPQFHAPAGTDVYTRASSIGTPDSSFTTVVYAVS
jgi:hypothetical protein